MSKKSKNITNNNSSENNLNVINNETNEIMHNAIKPSKKELRKERKRQKKLRKSYIYKVLAKKENTPVPLLILEFLLASVLDLLRILKNLILSILVILIICCVVGGTFAWTQIEPYYTEYNNEATEIANNSNYSDFRLAESSYVYDSDGKVIAKLKSGNDSVYLNYDNIPSTVVDAFVAIEDRTFWDNAGIDLKGIVRILYNFVQTKGEEKHGASTITQQLARNIYLTHEVSIERKIKEILISLKLTKKYTKQEIMEFYCNDICFANALYGIEAAANGYFSKNVDELSLSQIAYLCAIPNSPEYYNPYKYPERALERRNKILNDMLELGYISNDEYDEAIKEEIVIEKPTYKFNDYLTTYAVDCATRYLMEEDGFNFIYKFDDMKEYNKYCKKYDKAYADAKNKLYTGGYQIHTSLDSKKQKQVQKILNEQLSFDKEKNGATGAYALQGAITVFDNTTNKVVAVVGGRTQKDSDKIYSLNRAYQSYRQPGSTIKPLVVYTPALMKGYTDSTIVKNISISDAKKKGVDVQSLNGPTMTLRSALEQSKNGVAWQTFDKFGADYCMSFLNKMQFSKICPDDYYNSASLGGLTNGVTTVEMAGAYAAINNNGVYVQPTCITSMIDREGNEVYTEGDEIQVYDIDAANTMEDMMEGVLTNGTASRLNWYNSTNVKAACKTGTTNNSKDGWLCGFTDYYTVAVWVGYDQPKTLSNLYGATYPGQIWKETMLSLLSQNNITDYDISSNNSDYILNGNNTIDNSNKSSYNSYLPGRSDDEILSSGYTVADYRNDRVIGESIQSVINDIEALDNGDPRVDELYNLGCTLVNTIYSVKYTNEMQSKLNAAYNSKK